MFPLYLYPPENAITQKNLLDVSPWPADEEHGGRVLNLNPKFVAKMAKKLGLTFYREFGPEDIFHYICAIFHSPAYRRRCAEFLKFEGVPPDVWEFSIGGCQVLHKWLKDRRGRQLSYDDLAHYQQVVAALKITIDLMQRIDGTIPEWPVQ